jgi:aspartyl-tRNA(Asn)/glutamyl-tRNA(Gln) amidotransferase subunit C
MKVQGGVTIEDVRQVAELANLELTPEEEPRMQRDLNAILGHIAQLNELNTSGVPAMAQVSEMLDGVPDGVGGLLRADVIVPSLNRSIVMAAAPDGDGRFFKVPKVIER